ncbi:MAG: hypothetical protein CMP58_00010 [Flavobacteriales bacterium]|nr:hypothetical protein [Flavobacteriales bacterium]
MKKVLLLTYLFQNSYKKNSSTFFWDYAISLKRSGYDVAVLSVIPISIKEIFKQRKIDIGFKYYLGKEGVKVYTCQIISLPFLKRLNYFLKFFVGKKIFSFILNSGWVPDLIHVHSFLTGKLPVWIKNKFNVNYIITEHNSGFYYNHFSKYEMQLAINLYSNSISNYAVSHSFVNHLNGRFVNLKNKFKYFPNVIDVNFFNYEKKNKYKFDFINVGRLDNNKNHLMLMKSFLKSFPHPSSKNLIIIGDGPNKKTLNEFIYNNNLHGRVFLKGELSRIKIAEYLNSSKFFILTSLHETFGVSVIEAMSCGLPVISTFCGGPESIIINNTDFKNGILCENEKNKISAAMLDVFEINFDRQRIREQVFDKFSHLEYVNLIKENIDKT